MHKHTAVIKVSMLHGAVKFQYDNGQSRELNNSESLEFQERYQIARRCHVSEPSRVKIHVANRYFH